MPPCLEPQVSSMLSSALLTFNSISHLLTCHPPDWPEAPWTRNLGHPQLMPHSAQCAFDMSGDPWPPLLLVMITVGFGVVLCFSFKRCILIYFFLMCQIPQQHLTLITTHDFLTPLSYCQRVLLEYSDRITFSKPLRKVSGAGFRDG